MSGEEPDIDEIMNSGILEVMLDSSTVAAAEKYMAAVEKKDEAVQKCESAGCDGCGSKRRRRGNHVANCRSLCSA